MPGTLVSDSLATDILAGATLNSAGTTQSTIVDIEWPRMIGVEIDTGTVTGTSPTLDVEIEGSDSSTFGSGVVTLTQLPTVGDDDDAVARGQVLYCPYRYIRAQVVVGGTSPVFTGTAVTLVEPHFQRTPTSDASTN